MKYIILIARLQQWAWDYLLFQPFFQHRDIELSDYVDDLTVTCYENNNNAEFGDSSVECAVCLCRIGEGDEIKQLRCNHLYHRVCLDRWVGYGHRTCPLCRYNLKPPPLLADLHHAEAEVILINFCATRSRDHRRTWWLR
ncbi:E3 ubiquitin-protein ligase EL5-like [Olea europaea var. sylvestris]|uniref:E3 ubiquitin-protein ligase EL5-like n=1 Tax=Olea europaea var. sylvestris TaxID=158386 RepID=UPI000C1D268A|nr:E3 ubiquitin-protein ligase EL5-like [Olea europaea var. sylvestris]